MAWATADVTVQSVTDAYELQDWLDRSRELRGHSAVAVPPAEVGYQGPISDIVAVALSSGGAVAMLIRAVLSWMELRRNSGKIHVKFRSKDGAELQVEVDRVHDRDALLDRVLRFLEGQDAGE